MKHHDYWLGEENGNILFVTAQSILLPTIFFYQKTIFQNETYIKLLFIRAYRQCFRNTLYVANVNSSSFKVRNCHGLTGMIKN